jgi:hypothetical protein
MCFRLVNSITSLVWYRKIPDFCFVFLAGSGFFTRTNLRTAAVGAGVAFSAEKDSA